MFNFQNNFTALLVGGGIIIVILVIGIAGWVAWRSEGTGSRSSEEPAPQAEENEELIEESAGWERIVSGSAQFSVRIPDGWSVVNCINTDWLYVRHEEDTDGQALAYSEGEDVAVEERECSGFSDIVKFSIRSFGTGEDAEVRAPHYPPQGEKREISAQNVDGERFCRSETRRPYESAPAIVNSCDYVFRGDTYQHWVTYQQLEGEENRRELVDAVVHTMEAF